MIIASRVLYLLLVSALPAACGDPAARDDAPAPSAVAAPEAQRPVVLFVGTSLTAGLGLPLDQAFPALIQARLDAAGLDYRVINAGVSGDTSAGGLRRIDWLLRQPVAALVLELGANDMLRGQDLDALRANLLEIIARTRAAHPSAAVLVAGMLAPLNLGEPYRAGFEAVFREVAAATGAQLVPFLLEGVATVPELNLADGRHPNAEGHRRIAETVWEHLAPLLRGVEGPPRADLQPQAATAAHR